MADLHGETAPATVPAETPRALSESRRSVPLPKAFAGKQRPRRASRLGRQEQPVVLGCLWGRPDRDVFVRQKAAESALRREQVVRAAVIERQQVVKERARGTGVAGRGSCVEERLQVSVTLEAFLEGRSVAPAFDKSDDGFQGREHVRAETTKATVNIDLPSSASSW